METPSWAQGESAMQRGATVDGHLERYDRLVITLAPIFIVTQYLLFVLMHHVLKWRPHLTLDAVRAWSGKGGTAMSPEGWREFHIDAAQLVWSGFFHLVYGPTAVVLMWPYFSGDVTPIRALGDWTALLADGDVEFIRLTEAGGLMGSIFGALMVDYLFYWAVGWDKVSRLSPHPTHPR